MQPKHFYTLALCLTAALLSTPLSLQGSDKSKKSNTKDKLHKNEKPKSDTKDNKKKKEEKKKKDDSNIKRRNRSEGNILRFLRQNGNVNHTNNNRPKGVDLNLRNNKKKQTQRTQRNGSNQKNNANKDLPGPQTTQVKFNTLKTPMEQTLWIDNQWYQGELINLQNKITDLTNELDQKTIDIDNYQAKIRLDTTRIEMLKKEVRDKTVPIQPSNNSQKIPDEKIYQDQIKERTLEIIEQDALIERLKDEQKKWNDANRKLQKDNETLKQKNTKLGNDIILLQGRLNPKSPQKNKKPTTNDLYLQQIISNLKSQISDKDAKIEALENDNEKYADNYRPSSARFGPLLTKQNTQRIISPSTNNLSDNGYRSDRQYFNYKSSYDNDANGSVLGKPNSSSDNDDNDDNYNDDYGDIFVDMEALKIPISEKEKANTDGNESVISGLSQANQQITNDAQRRLSVPMLPNNGDTPKLDTSTPTKPNTIVEPETQDTRFSTTRLLIVALLCSLYANLWWYLKYSLPSRKRAQSKKQTSYGSNNPKPKYIHTTF